MAWKVTDYNLNLLHKKTDRAIEKRYGELSQRVSRMVSTFERHGVNPRHVQNIREVLNASNETRRDKEKAIMELRRYTLLETASYTQYSETQREAKQTWKAMGIGRGYSEEKWNNFFEFLDWVKSFSGGRYELNSVKEAWKLSGQRVTEAEEIWETLDNDYL